MVFTLVPFKEGGHFRILRIPSKTDHWVATEPEPPTFRRKRLDSAARGPEGGFLVP
jgi:hypothetical protein